MELSIPLETVELPVLYSGKVNQYYRLNAIRLRFLVIALMNLFGLVGLAWAQADQGAITGLIQDPIELHCQAIGLVDGA